MEKVERSGARYRIEKMEITYGKREKEGEI